MAPILSIQENLVPGGSVEERLGIAISAGFDGLELRSARPERLTGLLRAALRAPRRYPTVCPTPSGWLGDFEPAARRRAVRELRAELDGIAALGGQGVIAPAAWGMFTRRLPPFDEPPRTPTEDREVLLEGLRELGDHAAGLGVQLLLEPLNRYEDHMVNTVAQAAELIVEAGSPGVRILADTYHMNIEEDDPASALRSVASLLGAVHLSDSNRGQPGTGHVPFDRVVETLRDVCFSGTLSVECRLRGQPSAAVTDCGRYLRTLLADW